MNLVHTPAQARRFDAFDAVAGDFLKMFCVAVMSGLFFSLVAGLVVFLIASNAYASPSQEVFPATAAAQTQQGGRLLLARANGQLHPANLIETDVYAKVTPGKAMVRVTQTFANPRAAAKGVQFAFDAPADATIAPCVRISFAGGNGTLNLMIDLESTAEAVTASDPLAAIERNGGAHVVSLINRPLPRDFELRWTVPAQIARSARND